MVNGIWFSCKESCCLIYCNNIAIDLLDVVKLFIFEIVQGGILFVQENGLDVKIVEDPEFFFADAAIKFSRVGHQQLTEMKNGFISPVNHIRGP